MSKGTVEIPIEVWEHCQQDAERMAWLHKECIKLQAEVERLRKAGDAMYDAAVQDSMGLWVMPAFEQWSKIKNETK